MRISLRVALGILCLGLVLVWTGCEQASIPSASLDAPDKPEPALDFDQEPPDSPPALRTDGAPAAFGTVDPTLDAVPDQYIVVFKDQQMDAAGVRAMAGDLVRRHGGTTLQRYEHALRGFAARLPAAAVKALADHPAVAFVEPDRPVYALTTQTGATWGLDRIDQRDRPLDGTYTYTPDGTGVTAFIIDTGIRTSHDDFGGRAQRGFDAFGGNSEDCNGHGTHVAGTVGGASYGVAKNATLVAVRVLSCSGSGSTSGVIAGVDWVTQQKQNDPNRPMVANMSLGGGASTSLDNAIQNSIAAGVTYAVAAGNENQNACNVSPARVDEALTVGSTTSSDSRSSFSNFGSCVDVFAPGSGITSAWYTSNTATNTISGTSMAAPHVAGAAALYLDENPSANPSAVFSAVTSTATSGRLSSIGSGSPNLLLFSPFDGAGGGGDGGDGDGGGTAPCTGCETFAGSLTGTGDSDYQPNGTYYYSGSGTHTGYLRGPAGADFDLYLQKWSWGRWRTVAQGTSSNADEDVSYNGSSGYYVWRVYSYSGTGDYTFYLNRP